MMQRLLVLGAATLALAACGSDGTGPQNTTRLAVSFRAGSVTAPATAATADGVALGDGNTARAVSTADGLLITSGDDDLEITRAQLVVKDVKLKKAVSACLDDDDSDDDSPLVSTAASRRDDDDDDDDNCPTISVGPYLVNVPMNGAEGVRLAVEIPEGTYTSVRLRLHKVSSSSPLDLAFRNANPDFRDISVRLEGTFNGAPFVFVSDVNAQLDVPLMQPLVIGAGGDDLTVAIDMGAWFVRPGGGLYSPAEANTPGQVRARVQNNIRSGFRAFRDRNRDGRED